MHVKGIGLRQTLNINVLLPHQVSLAPCDELEGSKRQTCLNSLHEVDSCYVATVHALRRGDRISLHRQDLTRRIVSGPAETFFGVAKL